MTETAQAIFFEFTLVCAVWLILAVIGDGIQTLRHRYTTRRIIARRLKGRLA